MIKFSDLTDNGTGVVHTLPAKLRRAATKYRPLVPVLKSLVMRADTPLDDTAKAHVLAQLDLAEERFAGILGDPPPQYHGEAA